MLTLQQRIRTIYPELTPQDFVKTIILINDDPYTSIDAPSISFWGYKQPQPSKDVLAAVEDHLSSYASSVQERIGCIWQVLDAVSISRGFRDCISASSYAALPKDGAEKGHVKRLREDGASILLWKAKVWEIATKIFDEVRYNTPLPTMLASMDLIPSLQFSDNTVYSKFSLDVVSGKITWKTSNDSQSSSSKGGKNV
jgi:hypothetical protein